MLFITFLLSAVAAIASHLAWPGQWLPYGPLKALTTLLVIAHAVQRGAPGDPRRRALLAGLGLSLLGDVALLWPQQGFLPGLVAFLLAHLAYLVAFTRGVRLGASPPVLVAYALLALALLALLWPGVPPALRAPVVAYVVCLAAMAAQTASAWRVARGDADKALARSAAIGGALFLISDTLLAFDRFHSPLPLAALWILASYWAAQWLIAGSLPPHDRVRSARTTAQMG
jgi:uncharacterized membrane protein YhhN